MRTRSPAPTALIARCLLLMAGIVVPAPAATAIEPGVFSDVTSSYLLPIGGEFTLPNSPCMPGGIGELVALAGQSRVVTQVTMTSTGPVVRIFINLTDEMGTSRPSGRTFAAVGDFRTAVQLSPGAPAKVPITAAFELVQTGVQAVGCSAIPGAAPVSGTLAFNSDWTLNPDETHLSFGRPH